MTDIYDYFDNYTPEEIKEIDDAIENSMKEYEKMVCEKMRCEKINRAILLLVSNGYIVKKNV